MQFQEQKVYQEITLTILRERNLRIPQHVKKQKDYRRSHVDKQLCRNKCGSECLWQTLFVLCDSKICSQWLSMGRTEDRNIDCPVRLRKAVGTQHDPKNAHTARSVHINRAVSCTRVHFKLLNTIVLTGVKLKVLLDWKIILKTFSSVFTDRSCVLLRTWPLLSEDYSS